MNFIFDLLGGLIKLAIFLLGITMLVGGGSCAAVGLYDLLKLKYSGSALGYASLWILFSLIIAGIGYFLIKPIPEPTDVYIESETEDSNDRKKP